MCVPGRRKQFVSLIFLSLSLFLSTTDVIETPTQLWIAEQGDGLYTR